MASNSFVENINTIANAASLVTGDIVADLEIAKENAISSAEESLLFAQSSKDSSDLSQKWATNGHRNPVTGVNDVDAHYSSYHWATEAKKLVDDTVIRDGQVDAPFISPDYTWSSEKLNNLFDTKSHVDHNHIALYEPIREFHGSAYNKNFTPATFADNDNGNSEDVARGDHIHSYYEPKRLTHGTAYNKDFGTSSGTVADGGHNHDSRYMPSVVPRSAYNVDFVADINAPQSHEVPRGNHHHLAQGVVYDNIGNSVISSSTVQGAINQLDAQVGTVTINEKSKLTANMSESSHEVTVDTAGVFYPVNPVMSTANGFGNAIYSNGIVVNYEDEPLSYVEGQLSVTLAMEVIADKSYRVALASRDSTVVGSVPQIIDGSTLQVSEVGYFLTGIHSVSLSMWLTDLSNHTALSVVVSNDTDTTDIKVYDMVMSWAGQPEGALVVSAYELDHSLLAGTGAAEGVHTISDLPELVADLATRPHLVPSPSLDNLVAMDANGDLKDSGISITGSENHMDKIAVPTLDNIVVMDINGQSKDGGLTINDLAPKNGNTLETFSVANSVLDSDAINQGQIQTLAATYATKSELDAHESAWNPHSLTYVDVGASPMSHTHSMNEIGGLGDALDEKYSKTSTPVTFNIPSYDASDNLIDSGMSANSILLSGEPT